VSRAQYLRVWRPLRLGHQTARLADQIPDQLADIAVSLRSVGNQIPAT